MTVDTLKISKKLEDAGLPKGQAEAITEVLGSLAHDELVTRDYLDVKLEKLRAELFRLMFGAVTIIIAAMALLRFWPS
jgi:hypothetical protein